MSDRGRTKDWRYAGARHWAREHISASGVNVHTIMVPHESGEEWAAVFAYTETLANQAVAAVNVCHNLGFEPAELEPAVRALAEAVDAYIAWTEGEGRPDDGPARYERMVAMRAAVALFKEAKP